MPTATITLTTSWQQASTLFRTKLLADSLPEPLYYSGDRLVLTADDANVGKIYWTDTPISDNIADDLLPEEQQLFQNGHRFTLQSLHSLFLKAANNGDKANINLHY